MVAFWCRVGLVTVISLRITVFMSAALLLSAEQYLGQNEWIETAQLINIDCWWYCYWQSGIRI